MYWLGEKEFVSINIQFYLFFMEQDNKMLSKTNLKASRYICSSNSGLRFLMTVMFSYEKAEMKPNRQCC